MKNSRKRKKPEVPSEFISAGWKRVDVGNELLLGSEEGGFMELEELVPPSKSSSKVDQSRPVKPEDIMAASPTETSTQKKQKPDRKTRVKSKPVMKTADAPQTAQVSIAPEAEQSAEDVEGLKAKLDALKKENEALKCAAPSLMLCPNITLMQNANYGVLSRLFHIMPHADLAKHGLFIVPIINEQSALHDEQGSLSLWEYDDARAPRRALKSGPPRKEKHILADPDSARSRKLAAKRARAKEVRATKKSAAKARKLRAAERAEQQTGTCGSPAPHSCTAAMDPQSCQACAPSRHLRHLRGLCSMWLSN